MIERKNTEQGSALHIVLSVLGAADLNVFFFVAKKEPLSLVTVTL